MIIIELFILIMITKKKFILVFFVILITINNTIFIIKYKIFLYFVIIKCKINKKNSNIKFSHMCNKII